MKFSLENPMAHDVLRLYQNGMTPTRIIDVKGLGCTAATLTKWLRRNGAVMREKNYFRFAPDNASEIIDLYESGETLGRVIEKLDLNTSTVTLRKWLIKQGVSVRSIGMIEQKLSDKICELCGETYSPNSSHQRFCTPCVPSLKKKSHITRYGISPEQYNEAVARANGCCELCGEKKKLNIDHDHRTGHFRGLLCRVCNMAMAYVDNSEWLSKAFVYQGKDHIVPAVEVIRYKERKVI